MQYDEKGDNMLYIADKLGELNFRQLMDVYEEGNLENAAKFYPREPQNQWLLLAEQAFHQYLRECFFPTKGARYCLWIVDGRYFSALRLEPYRDGLLLEALETHPAERRKGYAAALVNAVLTKTACFATLRNVQILSVTVPMLHTEVRTERGSTCPEIPWYP